MDVVVRRALPNDVDGIVSIHQLAFKDFFLTSLGRRFLKLYYSCFISNVNGVVYCAAKGNQIVGFSATAYKSKGFNSSMLKTNLLKFILVAFRLLISNPKAIVRLAKNMNKESTDSKIIDSGKYAELYSIAVSPKYQGGGVGRNLLSVTEADVKDHNKRISLTTDYYNNDKTIAFYRALGYKEYYDFVTYPNRRMWKLIKELK